jgi:hypothetical protein
MMEEATEYRLFLYHLYEACMARNDMAESLRCSDVELRV